MKDLRIKKVGFGDGSIYKAFLELKSGKFEEKMLYGWIEKAILALKEDPLAGVKVLKNL